MTKDERQEVAIQKWRDNKGIGTFNLIMRFGKTRIAKKIIERSIEKHPNLKIIIICPNEITYKNAKDNLYINDNCNIYTSSKFINYIKNIAYKESDFKCDILILDEIHKMLDGEIFNCISKLKYTWTVGLTGSKLTNKDIKILNSINFPIIDYISEVEAVANGWISNSIEYNIPVELSEEEKKSYARYSELISEVLEQFKGSHNKVNTILGYKVFDSDFDFVLACFLGKKLNVPGYHGYCEGRIFRNIIADIMGWKKGLDLTFPLNQQIERYWNPDNIYENTKVFKNYVKKRNDILICNRAKINLVIEICKLNKVPTICFNESIEMIDTLANQFPKDGIAYHSAIESRYVYNPDTNDIYRTKSGEPKKIGSIGLKKLAIEGIKKGNIKYLFTGKSLTEGLTIENIEQVITTGGSTDPKVHEQKIARGKSFDYTNPNKVTTIINIYIDDFILNEKEIKSRDKSKLILRQKESETVPIWVNSIDEIFSIKNQ